MSSTNSKKNKFLFRQATVEDLPKIMAFADIFHHLDDLVDIGVGINFSIWTRIGF